MRKNNVALNTASLKRRSSLSIMGSLIGLVKPLLHIMVAAILLGTAGYLCAIFLTILAGQVIIRGLADGVTGNGLDISRAFMEHGWLAGVAVKRILVVMIAIAVLRGILHYAEQYCNHFIAFKLLAIIRHKVFAALRKLCPAKLEGRDKGNLISIITTDIELLEVFYAHTISPIAIAAVTSLIMVLFIGSYHAAAGGLALIAYLVIGLVILLITLIVWRRMEGKEPIKLNGKTVGTVVLAIFGALLLGIGMSLCMVFGKMILGVVIGLVGIVVLLMLIPLTKGLK